LWLFLNVEDGSARQAPSRLDAQTIHRRRVLRKGNASVDFAPSKKMRRNQSLPQSLSLLLPLFPCLLELRDRRDFCCAARNWEVKKRLAIQFRSGVFFCVLCSVFSVVNATPANRTRSLGPRDQISVRLLDLSSFCEYRFARNACNSQISPDSGL
jgi:hypothetical protein